MFVDGIRNDFPRVKFLHMATYCDLKIGVKIIFNLLKSIQSETIFYYFNIFVFNFFLM